MHGPHTWPGTLSRGGSGHCRERTCPLCARPGAGPLPPAAPSSAVVPRAGRAPPEPSPPHEVWTVTAPSKGPGARGGKRRPPCPGAAAPVLGDQTASTWEATRGWSFGGSRRAGAQLTLPGHPQGLPLLLLLPAASTKDAQPDGSHSAWGPLAWGGQPSTWGTAA